MKKLLPIFLLLLMLPSCNSDEPKEEQETPNQVENWEEDNDWEGELIIDID